MTVARTGGIGGRPKQPSCKPTACSIVFGLHSYRRMMDGQLREACDPLYDDWLQRAFTDMLKTMEAFGPVWIALLALQPRPHRHRLPFPQRDAETDCTNRDYQAAVAAAAPNATHRRPPQLHLPDRTGLHRRGRWRPTTPRRPALRRARRGHRGALAARPTRRALRRQRLTNGPDTVALFGFLFLAWGRKRTNPRSRPGQRTSG